MAAVLGGPDGVDVADLSPCVGEQSGDDVVLIVSDDDVERSVFVGPAVVAVVFADAFEDDIHVGFGCVV